MERRETDRPTHVGEPPSRAWLRFQDHDVELGAGETIVGRSPSCHLVIDDPLVSRNHARLVLSRGTVTVEDLGSANGVLINGDRLVRARVLRSGDRVVIGQQSFLLLSEPGERPADAPVKPARFGAMTLNAMRSVVPSSASRESEQPELTRKGDALDLLAGVADKVLALGRGDEAERILSSYLRNLLQSGRVSGEIGLPLAEKAALYAVRIAEATGKGTWVDYVFELYGVVKRPLPAPVVERLYESVRKLSPVSAAVFRQYLGVLRAAEPQMGPADRFLLRRVEGLESLGVLK